MTTEISHSEKRKPNDLFGVKNGEFNMIAKLSSHVAHLENGIGIGDDCAVVEDRVYTTDMSIEGVHFRLDWQSPEEALEKCLLTNLSDINAMGARAEYMLAGIAMPGSMPIEKRNLLAEALGNLSAKYNLPLVGGDMSRADQLVFYFTICGKLSTKPLLRSGAQPGDLLVISSAVGESAAGLWALENNKEKLYPELVKAHLMPKPPLPLGEFIANKTLGRASCIDISDGLISETAHLAKASDVAIEIDEVALQKAASKALKKFCQQENMNLSEIMLHSGEEYQLLCTIPDTNSILNDIFEEYAVWIIGRVEEGSNTWLKTIEGKRLLDSQAWSHF
jgi:thiamine-monophosphate kinase